MRRFRLKRVIDSSGVSGVGYVVEGVEFSNGQCVLHWLTEWSTLGIYASAREVVEIHGHDGNTVLEWIDKSTNP